MDILVSKEQSWLGKFEIGTQKAWLWVSNFQKKVAISEGKVVEKTFVPLALSYDHRVINGGDAGRFMVYLKDILESLNGWYLSFIFIFLLRAVGCKQISKTWMA